MTHWRPAAGDLGMIGADVRPVHPVPEIKSGPMQGALLNLREAIAGIYLLRNTLCGEFDQERVYGGSLPGSRKNFLVGSSIFSWEEADAIRADADWNT
jgi:hypothetical protein